MTIINVPQQFSATPGARFRTDGPNSGEEFRERFLEPLFENKADESPIQIVLDGSEGYATSFLEEAFGGLARKFGPERCTRRISFVSTEDALLVTEIMQYMNDAQKK